jgi:hypothetical protein
MLSKTLENHKDKEKMETHTICYLKCVLEGYNREEKEVKIIYHNWTYCSSYSIF